MNSRKNEFRQSLGVISLLASLCLSPSASACMVCAIPGAEGFAISNPKILQVAVATRKAVEAGSLKDVPNGDAATSISQAPNEVILKFLAMKEVLLKVTQGETVHVLVVDSDQRYAITLDPRGMNISSNISGASSRQIITTRKTLIAILNRSLAWEKARALGIVSDEKENQGGITSR